MYLPAAFAVTDPRVAADVMRAHPFASLITLDDGGLPFVTHLPLHIQEHAAQAPRGLGADLSDDAQGGDDAPATPPAAFTLLGHVARGNPQWRHLATRPNAVVTFQGPHAYMSPSVYPDLARVPTWNYVALHATVQPRLIDHADGAAKDALLKALIADFEPAYAAQWRGMEPALATGLLKGIVAFELVVTAWQCKVKLNQHRPESHAALRAGYAAGTPDEQALGEWMDRLGIGAAASPAGEGA